MTSGEDLSGRVLYRDGRILVLDKPPGLPVHAGPSGAECVEDHLRALRFGLPHDPQPVHRLDADTAGCLVLARHRKWTRRLGRLFSEGRVAKTYWAVTARAPADDRGVVDAPLAKTSSASEGWRMVVDRAAGKPARTGYRILGGAEDGTTWLELHPETGRTHQVRVHCAALGCAIVGEPRYAVPDGRPLHLLARRIELPLSADAPPLVVEAAPPPHMHAALAACGWTPAV